MGATDDPLILNSEGAVMYHLRSRLSMISTIGGTVYDVGEGSKVVCDGEEVGKVEVFMQGKEPYTMAGQPCALVTVTDSGHWEPIQSLRDTVIHPERMSRISSRVRPFNLFG